MENLELQNYGAATLSAREMREINGGQDPNGCQGCSDGKAFRSWLSRSLDVMVDVFRARLSLSIW